MPIKEYVQHMVKLQMRQVYLSLLTCPTFVSSVLNIRGFNPLPIE